MIVVFPLLVSRNVKSQLSQGIGSLLEQYIAAYALDEFFGRDKRFNKYYDYKIKKGKVYKEHDASWFDLDPATQNILKEQDALSEVIVDQYGNPLSSGGGKKSQKNQRRKKTRPKAATRTTMITSKDPKGPGFIGRAADRAQGIKQGADAALSQLSRNQDPETKKPVEKPEFNKATMSTASINLEPTWITVNSEGGGEKRLGIKVVPMMIEGFNIKHTLSKDMGRFFLTSFMSEIGRKAMRAIYGKIDSWSTYGKRPRGSIRHDLFYARTGHNGQPFVLLDKNEDIPQIFFSQPKNLLKLWRLSWGNMIISDDAINTVMFCMKTYKGICSTFTYAMVYAQTKEMGKVFEDMENARKATGALFKFNKKITDLGGK